jgi:hypothetical protein
MIDEVRRTIALNPQSIGQSSIVNRRLRCSDRTVDPTLDFVSAIGRGVGYRDAAIF